MQCRLPAGPPGPPTLWAASPPALRAAVARIRANAAAIVPASPPTPTRGCSGRKRNGRRRCPALLAWAREVVPGGGEDEAGQEAGEHGGAEEHGELGARPAVEEPPEAEREHRAWAVRAPAQKPS